MATPRATRPSGEVFGRIVLSVIIAVSLWSWVTLSRDPETTRRVPNVSVEVTGLAPDLMIVGDVPSVTASYTGTRSNVDDLIMSESRATVNLGDVDAPGTYSVDVHVPEPPDVWSVRAEPRTLTLQIERIQTATFDVVPTVTGDLGLNQQVGAIRPSAGQAAVSGPESLVGRVQAVELPVDIANRTANFVGVFTPVAIDATGQQVGGVSINPDSISAEVQITARGRQLAVVAQITGSPASGYEIVDRAINPIIVLVDGPEETINSLVTVSTLPVDVTGATSDITRRVRLADLPPGVTVIEPSSGYVDVVVQIRQRGVQQSLPEQPVIVLNLDPALSAVVDPGVVVVNVEASEQQLVELEPGTLQVVVDAAGLGPGTYTLRPSVVVPATLEWQSVMPDTVTVTLQPISPEATPSPPISVAATPAAAP